MTLRFAHEVRSEADYFSDIPEMKLPPEMVKLAQHIIKTPSVVVARAAASAKAARETLLGRSRSGARMPSPIRSRCSPGEHVATSHTTSLVRLGQRVPTTIGSQMERSKINFGRARNDVTLFD